MRTLQIVACFSTAGSVSTRARGGGHSKFIHLCCNIISNSTGRSQGELIVCGTVNFQVLYFIAGSVSTRARGGITVSLFI